MKHLQYALIFLSDINSSGFSTTAGFNPEYLSFCMPVTVIMFHSYFKHSAQSRRVSMIFHASANWFSFFLILLLVFQLLMENGIVKLNRQFHTNLLHFFRKKIRFFFLYSPDWYWSSWNFIHFLCNSMMISIVNFITNSLSIRFYISCNININKMH